MSKFPIAERHHSGARAATFAAGLLAALLCGCVVQEPPKIPVAVTVETPPSKPVALSDVADAALKMAEQSVTEARIKRALWTAAVVELERAKSAAKEFDSAATIKHAREVVALCGLSIAQLSAAPVKW